MSTFDLYPLLAHQEDGPGIRHPLIVIFHLLYVLVLIVVYISFSSYSVGQTIYFCITIGLYLCSAAYHTWKPNWRLRFLDQTMISWYVLGTPVPFICHEWWTLPLYCFLATATAANKWFQWEPSWAIGSLVFFGLGALSTILLFTIGWPASDVLFWSKATSISMLAIGCFIAKLVIYHYQKGMLYRNVWEAPESGHFVLSLGVSLHTYTVLAYAV